ncbi:MAG: cation transporter, partial [Asticcacaulis sp.]|nr:cation transporter [Asticcacaulis sp.]
MAHDHHDHHGHKDNGHGHDHGHAHSAPTDFGPRFLVAAGLNAAFILAEVIYGLKAGSLALLADAGHNFSDVVGLLLAWVGWWLSKRRPRPDFTYGFRGASIMAALANGVLLLVAVVGIAWEAALRLMHPQIVAGDVVMWVAGLGIVVNGVTAWLFASGRKDLNIR